MSGSCWPSCRFAEQNQSFVILTLKLPQLFWPSSNLQKVCQDLEALVQTDNLVNIEINGVTNWPGMCIYGWVVKRQPSSNGQLTWSWQFKACFQQPPTYWWSISSYLRSHGAGSTAFTYRWSVLNDLCALSPLIQSWREHDENESNYNIQSTLRSASICPSVGYLSHLRCAWARTIQSIMTCSLSMLASYISKKLILDRIEDLSCAWSSIIGKENPNGESTIWVQTTRAVSQLPTQRDANRKCARTGMICLQKLRLCHE